MAEFKAADDRPSGGVTRCRNGQPYGIGLLATITIDHVRPGPVPRRPGRPGDP
ncbi:hypothetical protein [Micromonospora sp. ATCC 39149]|uniref:hypothetical protein n=1 Tax=Micromonospora sp. (strain ATCC 39149 / NRRL 15099 / SCC 1413) TaxID=219305 RepID=UPI0002F4753A|nr:hypothetical protein [Micromonospora sp. ATCC 39149]